MRSLTHALVRSLDVTDDLLKCRGWSRLLAWALIESSCLANDGCYFINPQPVCVCVCASAQLYTLATTHADRQTKCSVTQQVTRPAIFRIICELAFYPWMLQNDWACVGWSPHKTNAIIFACKDCKMANIQIFNKNLGNAHVNEEHTN